MAGSATRNRIWTTIPAPYKLSPNSQSLQNVREDTRQRTRRADSSSVRLQPRLPLTGKIQRSVVSKHPESHDPTNCVASENPRIAILVLNSVLNSLWVPRFRPSGRCIHARLPNVLNCVKRTVHPRPHKRMARAELYSGRKPKTERNLQGWLARQTQTSANPDDDCLSRDIAP